MSSTVDKGLVFERAGGNRQVVGFVNKDFVGCLATRKSISRYVFCSYGTAVRWKACLQKIVALLLTKAEYAALIEAIKEALWLYIWLYK